MRKFVLSLSEQSFKHLKREARQRNITIQELLRAVIVPEWCRENMRRDRDGELDRNLGDK